VRTEAAPARVGGLLWQRDFRLLWFGESVSQLGSAMAVVAMPLLAVTVLHASTFTVSALVAAAWLPWLVIGLPAGAWVDRLPCRAVMVCSDVVAAAVYASVPVGAWLGVLTIGQLLAVALLGGAASVFFGVAYQVNLPSLVSPAQLVEGNAKLQGSAAAARLGGPGLAGVVAEGLGAGAALLCNAVSFLVSAACLLRIRTPAPRAQAAGGRQRLRADISAGVRLVAGDRYLRPMGLFGAVANLALSGNQALIVVFLVRVVRLDPLAVGLLLAVPGASGVLGALTVGFLARRLGTARVLVLSGLGALPFGLLIPLTSAGARLGFYVAGTLVAATGVATASIIIASFRLAYTPPALRGRVTATMSVILTGTSPVGALLGGALGAALGVRQALWVVFGVAALSGTVLLTRVIVDGRDLPTEALASAEAAG
jgi:predicted MFS family arabinose efflux permease